MRPSSVIVVIAASLYWVVGAVTTSEAQTAKRVALVIGNSAYQHTRALPNPKNDASAIADALKRIGFDEVTLKLDQDYRSLRRSLRDFGSSVEGADVAIVYYAGHGMELGGDNYLVPTDARLLTDRDLEFEAVKLSTILRQVTPARRLRMVILDACRNNPLGSTIKLSQGVSRSVSRGFSRIEPEGDVLVAYAAKHGTVASDGDGSHSPYTAALLKHLETPGLEINFLFRRVRDSVRNSTARRQDPFTYGSLGSENVYLVAPPTVPQPDATRSNELASLRARLKVMEDRLQKQKRMSKDEPKVAIGIFPGRSEASTRRRFHPGQEFQDCETCPKMVVIPAGTFLMGSPPRDEQELSSVDSTIIESEMPQHRVTLPKSFAVGKYEVTVDQFNEFAKDSGRDMGNACLIYDAAWKSDQAGSYLKPGFSQSGSHPVVCTSWFDAKSYVRWLSKKTGNTYRLLSESEWEYCARAGSVSPFYTGQRISSGQANFNGWFTFNGSSRDRYRKKTVQVGHFASNAFGLHDLHGNAWELVEDCYVGSYLNAPSDGTPVISGNCEQRVVRGGSWRSNPANLRSSRRASSFPMDRKNMTGFRVARTLSR